MMSYISCVSLWLYLKENKFEAGNNEDKANVSYSEATSGETEPFTTEYSSTLHFIFICDMIIISLLCLCTERAVAHF